MSTTPVTPTAAEIVFMRESGLHWHKRGGWARKFPGDRNRTYFGRVSPGEALKLHAAEELRRQKGEPELAPNNLSIGQAVNLFLASLDQRYADGTIGASQRARYGQEMEFLVSAKSKDGNTIIGRHRRLSDFCQLYAPDTLFRPLRAAAVARGIIAGEKSIVQIRTFFDWCSTVRRFIPPAFFADAFDAPGEREKRIARKSERKARGTAYWTPEQVREIIEAARATNVHRYAQVLLTLNSGMGATDLSNLEDVDIDWGRCCIQTDRSKTMVPRVVPLWDITVEAMRRSRAARPIPADAKWADRFFLTSRGRPLVEDLGMDEKRKRHRRTDSLKNWFYRLLNAPDRVHWKNKAVRLRHLKRWRGGWYTLRAVFATLARGHAGDPNLDAIVMGQKLDRAILEGYLRGDVLQKLLPVVNHVRSQLGI